MTVSPIYSSRIRQHLINFFISAFQSLDSGLIRKECAPLVTISIWTHLHNESVREEKFEQNPQLHKAWRAALKRFKSADDATKARLRFQSSWLYNLLLDFLNRIYDKTLSGQSRVDNLRYCERFVEFLSDLQSQLPTRRYLNTLLQDMNLLACIYLSPIFNHDSNGLFRDLVDLLRHFTYFPMDDLSGQQLSQIDMHKLHSEKLSRFQRVAFQDFESQLKILSLSNYASLEQRNDMESHLQPLSDEELIHLCQRLGLRTDYPDQIQMVQDRTFYLEILIDAHQRRRTFRESLSKTSVLPTEEILYEPTFLRNEEYDASTPLAIPKLNLQYLTMGDFLWRSFILHRCDSFYAIRKDMEDVIKRMQPHHTATDIRFSGNSRMALPISKPAIVDVAPAKVGENQPAYVKAEVILNVGRLNLPTRKDWDALRPDDVVFLLAVEAPVKPDGLTNGHAEQDKARKIGLKHLRCAEVVQIQDEKGRPLREQQFENPDEDFRRVRTRRLILKLDSAAYKADIDLQAKTKMDIYSSINLIVRRRGRENNFKPILESIRRLALSEIPAPAWLQDVFLGYSDPSGATYKKLPNRLHSIDFRDTFLDWQHLVESFPGKTIEPADDMEGSFGPPYVLEFPPVDPEAIPVRPSKKRRRDEEVIQQTAPQPMHVATYTPPNMGPYPTDAPKLNSVRFTPAQVEAIHSGTQPGLTVIVGPPGTGKTDVATQIINNIYHNFPQQRTLLVAHSNQALNQLFQKIVALDIDERHLLRLGHGEEELETDASYSKHGRVESFLELGGRYLAEVNRLAISLEAPGAHGQSCETADYFNQVYIKPTWTEYWTKAQLPTTTADEAMIEFPFLNFFSNAPQPLFPDTSKAAVLDVVQGCYRHIEKMFLELEDIRPFEILRNSRDRANYLLIKEARIIAMTATHAAMRRSEIANLGFHYDNVVMEEAAQVTEIENFIPLALQNPKDGKLPLQRIVLCGDHLQNSPIIQNLAFRQFANLEQSLFLRLVRLGVPTVMLDMQGRARASLAALYKWRYARLGNLPYVEHAPEFLAANAGFLFEYQFINVADYKGRGEMEPTPHFIQNLGEAEYAVALFMYMRLLGYPASKISILTTYAGQRALIKDVLNHRCKSNRLFGLPRIVTTVDKYQGEQNDYIILSLVRTARVGYLRDIRRLTVALSRARLGLYIVGRREVFASSYELSPFFDLIFERPTTLTLVRNEQFPTTRPLNGKVEQDKVMEISDVEQLGKLVVEQTQSKVAMLKTGGVMLPPEDEPINDIDMDDEDGGAHNEDGIGMEDIEEGDEEEAS
jgi:intron-binding protein aquarius